MVKIVFETELYNVKQIDTEFSKLTEPIQKNKKIEIDFINVSRISSVGIAKIVELNSFLQLKDKHIIIKRTNEEVTRILRQVQILNLLSNITFSMY
jgi:anti-anti-sigma regulatory factor